MALLQKRQKKQEAGDGNAALAKRDPDRGALSRVPEYQRQIDRAFDRLLREFDRDPLRALSTLPARLASLADWPPIDIHEDDKTMTIRVDVPGLDANNLNVEVSGNVLTIRGQREDEWSGNERGVVRRERVSGAFARSITLPSYVDAARTDARYENGTLTITVPKIPGKGPRQVPVTAPT
jgi:HSP20 family protein